MKRTILSAIIIASMTFACQHDNANQVNPAPLNNLSSDELKIASSIGRLSTSLSVFSQAIEYQNSNPSSTFSVTVDRASLEAILKQPHTIGIRAFFINNSEGKLDLTITGIDKNLNNQFLDNGIFSGGKAISETIAKRQIEAFKTDNPSSIRAIAFGSPILLGILNRDNCAGLRFYFTIDKDGNRNLIFVGIDNQLKDMRISNPNARTINGDGDLGVDGRPCPQFCG